jgi:3-hydroxybutyryl-CoA dehydratase
LLKIWEKEKPSPIFQFYACSALVLKGEDVPYMRAVQGLISAALGMRFPGFGTIYMGQEAKFFNPIFIGEEVQVTLQISELQPEKKRLILSTQVIKENGDIAIDGFARVQFNPDLFAQSG